MTTTTRTVLATATLSLAALAGGSCAAQTQSGALDPCQLLTVAEVSAAMGQPVEPGRMTDNGVTKDGAYSTTCLWSVTLPRGTAPDPGKSLGGRSFAILNVMNWPGGPSHARKYLEEFRDAFEVSAITSRPVEIQIGADEALWWGDGVAARKDGVSIGMSVASPGDRAGRRPKAEGLAKLIVQRLGQRPV